MPTSPLSDRDLELLSAYMDGALPPSAREKLEARLAHDAALRAALDDLTANRLLLRQAPRLKAPRSFALDPALVGQRYPWWRRVTLPDLLQVSGALGAVAAIVLIAVGVLTGTGQQTGPAVTAPPAAEVAAYTTHAAPSPTATPLATATPPPGTPTPFPTMAVELETQAEQPAMAAPAPMLAQPDVQPGLSPQDTFSAEESVGEAGAAGMAAPPSAETQLREAPAAVPIPTVTVEGVDLLSPTPAATTASEDIADNASIFQPSPSPDVTQSLKSTAAPESRSPEEKTTAPWLIVAGVIVLLASGMLYGVGRWKGR